ncbi:MAG: hypothetical protein AAB588_02700 [Patescibacteria group bacterium]
MAEGEHLDTGAQAEPKPGEKWEKLFQITQNTGEDAPQGANRASGEEPLDVHELAGRYEELFTVVFGDDFTISEDSHDYGAHLEEKEGETHVVYDCQWSPDHGETYERVLVAYDAVTTGTYLYITLSVIRSQEVENGLTEDSSELDALLQNVMTEAGKKADELGDMVVPHAKEEAGLAAANDTLGNGHVNIEETVAAVSYDVFSTGEKRRLLISKALENSNVKNKVRELLANYFSRRRSRNRVPVLQIIVNAKTQNAQARFINPESKKLSALKLKNPDSTKMLTAAKAVMTDYLKSHLRPDENVAPKPLGQEDR